MGKIITQIKAPVKNRPVLFEFAEWTPRSRFQGSPPGHPKRSPWLFVVLGWLQGILLRVRGLGQMPNLMILLLGILQEKTTDTSNWKPLKKATDISTLKNQRWLVRKRNNRGQLRHVRTLNHEPTDEELKKYGAGSYSILTTKPHLQACKSVVIKDKGVSAPTKKVLKPASAEKAPQRSPKDVRQTGPKIPLTGRYDRVGDKEPRRKVITKRPVKPPVQPRQEPKEELADLLRKFQKPTVAEIVEPTQKISKDPGFPSPKPEEPRPKETCARCLEPSSSIITCDHCGQRLCRGFSRNCYEEHDCPNSKVCYKCERRVPNGIVKIAELCHQYFCSPKCMNECMMENIGELGCAGCRGGAFNKKEEKEADEEMEETNGREEESFEEDEQDEEEEEEMCDGVPKRIACRKCQKENCQGRFCDGYCNKCHFDYCEFRCEYDGECKFCPEFGGCEIRCKEAPDRCDKGRCRGFRCEERTVSGAECDQDCENCSDEGCFFWGGQDDGDYEEE